MMKIEYEGDGFSKRCESLSGQRAKKKMLLGDWLKQIAKIK
jgi:hypothetical protein